MLLEHLFVVVIVDMNYSKTGKLAEVLYTHRLVSQSLHSFGALLSQLAFSLVDYA